MPDQPSDFDFRFDQPSPEELGAGRTAPPGRPGLPWERRAEIGFFPALGKTLVVVLTNPSRAFREMRLDDDLWNPLYFLLIFGCTVAVVNFIFSMAGLPLQVFIWEQMERFGYQAPREELEIVQFFSSMAGRIVGLVLAPIVISVGAFVSAGLIHVVLLLWSGPQRGYVTTFKVVAFASGATTLVSLFPCGGGCIAIVWSLVVTILGLMAAHDIDGGRATVAVLAPNVLCCCAIAAAVMLVFVVLGIAFTAAGAVL